jgi:hypothetical protein
MGSILSKRQFIEATIHLSSNSPNARMGSISLKRQCIEGAIHRSGNLPNAHIGSILPNGNEHLVK